jgi:hypothetical protein
MCGVEVIEVLNTQLISFNLAPMDPTGAGLSSCTGSDIIATRYRPDSLGFKPSGQGETFHTCPNGPKTHPASCTVGPRFLSWG